MSYNGTFEDHNVRDVDEVAQILLKESAKDAQLMHVPWDPFNIELILVRARPVPEPKKESPFEHCKICGHKYPKGWGWLLHPEHSND